MKIRIPGLVLCLALVVSTITAVMVATPAAAQTPAPQTPTTSITVTRWGANSTILFQETIDYTAMQGNFTVQGDGTTHYYMEGPNFPPDDPLDANETGNLKDKGALMGTDLKDLCMWAGEPDALGNSTDTIKLTADDGFTTTLPYANVYNPPTVQGPAVICWWQNGQYVPTYSDGMQLVFFAQTTNAAGQHVYGDYDMEQTMPAAYQYYYQDALGNGTILYLPSTDGLSAKWISNIDIYTTAVPSWTLQLDGTAIGGVSYTMTEAFFEEGVAHHGAATWNDSALFTGSNDTYSGMPLWLLCGWVDDQVEHGAGAFNDALAAAGYNVKVIDGNYSKSFTSQAVATDEAGNGSNNYIIANLKNGAALPSSEYPLRLVGAGLSTKGQSVSQVTEIQLLPGTSWPTLTMGVSGNGTTTPAVGNSAYPANWTVSISATAASGWQFAGWTGAVGNSTDANTTVTMNGNQTVTANFSPITTEVPWTLQLDGTAIGGLNYTMTEAFFEEGVAHHGAATWNDSALFTGSNDTYSGMPLWLLCGWVDDQVEHGAGAFNDALAAAGYNVKVIDGNYSKSFTSQAVATDEAGNGSNNFIIANLKNGAALPSSEGPLRLVGAGLSTKGQSVSQVTEIQLLPGTSWPTLTMGVSGNGTTTPAVGNSAYPANWTVNISATAASGWQFAGWTGAVGNSTNANTTVTMNGSETVTANFSPITTEVPWTLQLDGTAIGGLNYTMTEAFFEEGVAHHGAATWNDSALFTGSNDTYSGMPLWLLCGWVDDQVEHGAGAFNDALAAAGYNVKVIDGNYSKSFTSQAVATDEAGNGSNNFIIANLKNGAALPSSEYPLRLVGAGLSTKGQSVSQVTEIQLLPGTSWPTLTMGVSGSGNTTPAVGNSAYPANWTVNISATAASGWQFAGWTGAVGNSTDANTTVTMNWNETVTANFSLVYTYPPAPAVTPTIVPPTPTAVTGVGSVSVGSIVSSTGVFAGSATLMTVFSSATVSIAAGTTGRTVDGLPLSTITVTPQSTAPAPPTGSNIVGVAYDFGPNGATFNPPITMTLHYNPASIPAGVSETSMVVAFYDTTVGQWVVLASCVVDPVAHTITVPVGHFTLFAVITSTPTPVPTAIPSPVPTPTPVPTAIPSPTPTPSPVPTATPVLTPISTSTGNAPLIGGTIGGFLAGALLSFILIRVRGRSKA